MNLSQLTATNAKEALSMNEPGRITVQYIDNETNSLQDKLVSLLGENITILATHNDEVKALNDAAKHNPSIILLNYEFREQQTVKYIDFLSKETQSSKILLLGNKLSDEEVINCLISGAQGYLELNEFDKFIEKAIKVIVKGEAWITRRMVGLLLDRLRYTQ